MPKLYLATIETSGYSPSAIGRSIKESIQLLKKQWDSMRGDAMYLFGELVENNGITVMELEAGMTFQEGNAPIVFSGDSVEEYL